jgi:hypothetical protein
MEYQEWIECKQATSAVEGFVDHEPLAEHLFPHQRDLVSWALRRGRAAIFADTGLGKTAMQLEWARHVSARRGPVLILAPLAVAEQTVREGERFGAPVVYAREAVESPITITNYEMLAHFDATRYAGIVLDESSILKAYDGKTRTAIIDAFARTPFRLACTATPAPNDHTELGNHSEFLGIKSRVEMLAEYFVHDGGSTQSWRLKGHAQDVFWRWVCTWGAVVRMPSDLGHDDGGFALPPLEMHEHVIPVDHADAQSQGLLFVPDAVSLSDQRATRRMTLERRVAEAARIADGGEPVLIWCELNAEGDALEQAIPGAVQVRGSDDAAVKTERLLGFASGKHRALVTKPSIAGFGMNWQHCARVVFVGASHSYEQTYQAIRRCWRFGQKRPVHVHVIRAENEGAIVANFRRKEADAARLQDSMVEHMRAMQRQEVSSASREWNDYEPSVKMVVPNWVGMEDVA